ncbi:MAG: Hsp33 family molecular chaperone HslO [Hydrogenibacillus sp.]|nr:Hsp33 family molecular chaperone HslO [Hydrogenibacillus sp.]
MDAVYRGLALGGQVRLFVAEATEVVRTVTGHVQTRPTASAALGRVVTMAALMASNLKNTEKVTLIVAGDGPLGKIVADAERLPDGGIGARGILDHPEVDPPPKRAGKLDVARAVGRRGVVQVVRHIDLKASYRGSVPLVSGEIAEDFAHYLSASEQTPSAVGLGVLVETDHTVRAAGGFLLQPVPGVSEDVLRALERSLAAAPPISRMIAAGLSADALARTLVDGEVAWLETIPLAFRCTCSEDRARATVRLLGAEILQEEIDRGEPLEVRCAFCRRRYTLTTEELIDLRRTLEPPPPNR